MRKLLLLVIAFAILIPASGMCASKKDKDKDKKDAEETQEKPKVYYRVYFDTGGIYEVDNYTIEKNHIMLQLDSGPIFLDKGMVTKIEKYVQGSDEPVQRINVTPTTTGQGGTPPDIMKPETEEEEAGLGEPQIKIVKPTPEKTETGRAPGSGRAVSEAAPEKEPTDDEGHDERWWKIEMNRWIMQREQGIKDYDDAKKEWNRYDGILFSLNQSGGASDYDILRYQDLRGAARIKMDRSESDIKEAENMLVNVIPEKARKAGAPKWWVQWDGEPWKDK